MSFALATRRPPSSLVATVSVVFAVFCVTCPAPAWSLTTRLPLASLNDDFHVNMWVIATVAIIVLSVLLFSFRSQVRDLVRREVSHVRDRESKMLEVTAAMSQEIQLRPLLKRIMTIVTDILDADRSTLFLYDNKTGELWSEVAQGLESKEIRFPAHMGIAGSVFTTGDTINIADAYKDSRFNKEIDRKTGYKTDSILCVQVRSKKGKPMGVIQVLNKDDGPFTAIDEKRLRAFTSQASIALENAQLFEEVCRVKNYNEAILDSMRNAVVTLDADRNIVKVNDAALALFRLQDEPDKIVGSTSETFFAGPNAWVNELIDKVMSSGQPEQVFDSILRFEQSQDGESNVSKRESASVNLSLVPLSGEADASGGCLLTLDDITVASRLKATMARYMPKKVADRLLEGGDEALGGTVGRSTILFSDIRDFTTFSERSGPQETVAMLNGYFTVMANLIMVNGGILDKYIGDAIMAVYGTPFATPHDADNAVKTAVEMFRALAKFNIRRTADDKASMMIGVGVSTGEVVSGNIGSERRMDYTVIGDGVNLAARLESATKAYHTRVLISEHTAQDLTQPFTLREVDRLRVKGKEVPVTIYEVMDAFNEHEFPNRDKVMETFAEGLTAYRERQWKDARSAFEAAVAEHPGDSLSLLYANRCNFFIETPPPEDWDGVWHMSQK